MTADLSKALEPLVSRVRTDVTAIKGQNGMAWTREALTAVRIKRHLDGSLPRGVCPIREGESTTRVAVFDLDSHKGEVSWAQMVATAEALVDSLERMALSPVVFRSTGGSGIHVFLIWDAPQDAYSVRTLLRAHLEGLGYSDGAKGVARQQIEVFPKQDSVPEGGFGNQFILPLAGKSAPLEPLADYEVMPREYALQLEWRPSAPVPVVKRPVREIAVMGNPTTEYAQLREALAAISNDTDPLGYDEWRDVISAIHHETGGSEEGYALALEFSARAPHFDQDELDDKVWTWLDRKGPSDNPITGRTILAKAREHGWVDQASADDFPDLAPVRVEGVHSADTPADPLPLPAFQRDGNGKIEPVVLNLRAALRRPDVCRMDIRFDEFRSEIVYCPDDEPGVWRAFQDHHYFDLRCQLETIGFKPIGRDAIRDAVHHRAQHATIDTAMLWLSSLVWDGVKRIDGFYPTYFGVEDTPYSRAVSRYVWTAHAGRVLEPGVKADMVPILTGEQGQRKSSGIEAMGPFDSFREMNFSQSEEARARLMRGALVVELAELSGLKTRAIEEIKAWTSRRKEDWTPKYREFSISLLRRMLCHGTTNDEGFLDDPTGARRWLPMSSGRVDVDAIRRDRDQLWAEAAVRFRANGVEWADAERLAKAEHVHYGVEADSWEQGLRAWLQEADMGGRRPADSWFRIHDALVNGLGLRVGQIRKSDEMRAAKVLRAIGCEKVFRPDEGGKTMRVWVSTSSPPPLA